MSMRSRAVQRTIRTSLFSSDSVPLCRRTSDIVASARRIWGTAYVYIYVCMCARVHAHARINVCMHMSVPV